MFLKILTWISTTISIAGFAMYLLDKADWVRFKVVKPWVLITIVIICTILAIVFTIIENKEPFSKKEKQAAAAIIGDMSLKFQLYHNELINLKNTREKWSDCKKRIEGVNTEDAINIQKEFHDYLIFRLSKIDSIPLTIKVSKESINTISKTDIPIEDINAFYNSAYPVSMQEIKDFYKKLQSEEITLLTSDWLDKATSLEFDMLQISGEMVYFSFLELIAEMPKKVKENYYANFAPFMIQFPPVKMLSKQEAKSLSDRAYNKYNDLMSEYSALVGSKDKDVKVMQQDFSRIQKKIEINNTLKEELEVKKVRLKQAQESLRNKCKLNKDDDKWLMYGKVIKLATAKMYEDAVISLDEYYQYNKSKDGNAGVYVNAMKIYYKMLLNTKKSNKKMPQISGVAIDTLGVIVIGIENNQKHSCINVGDIILFSKKQPVTSVDKFFEIAKTSEKRQLTVYRLNSKEEFELIDLYPVQTDPKIGVCNLFE